MRSAVLLIAFARPETTRLVFEAVRAARPPRLYVAVDGPRENRPDDPRLIEAVQNIVTAVDWHCELKTWFREQNFGCGEGPAQAISWFFDHEEEGIILEDDCLPSATFFPFCDTLLEKYRHDSRVAQVCGSSFIERDANGPSYYFTKYADIWGWATWRRSWRTADLPMEAWPAWRDAGGLERLCGATPGFVAMWTHIFNVMYADGLAHIWDYQWMFSCWKLGLISISPSVPLVRNLGFGMDATHHVHTHIPPYVRPAGEMGFPLLDSTGLELDPAIEQAIARSRYSVTRLTDLAARAERYPLLGPALVKSAKKLRSMMLKR